MTFPILPSNSPSGFYAIDNSLRFNDNDSAYLSRTPSSTGNRKTFSISFWTKFATPTNTMGIICVDNNSSVDRAIITTENSGKLTFFDRQSDSTNIYLSTTQYLRDVSAWYHILLAIDTTQATSSNRLKLYINGNQVTDFATANYGSQNYDTLFNLSSKVNVIGSQSIAGSKSSYFDGYLSEFNFIDGQALSPTDFGEFDEDSGIWKPKQFSGSYGTNGFYLEFENSGSLGADQSGNGNNFTPTNLASTDQTTDTPTNNFCTLNAIVEGQSNVAYSEGNLKASESAGDLPSAKGTIAVSSGKWYWEGLVLNSFGAIAIGTDDFDASSYPHNSSTSGNGWTYHLDGSGRTSTGSSITIGSSYTTNDIIGVALDMDNGTCKFYKNGTEQTTGSWSGLNAYGSILPAFYLDNTTWFANFGQEGSFGGNKTAQGNSDQNGKGDFYYTPPSGYLALCTQNLATALSPTIDDGSQYFNTVLWSGDGSNPRSLTGVGFQPDWLWTKARNAAFGHNVYDSSRGNDGTAYYRLETQDTASEIAQPPAGHVTYLDSDGFSVTNGSSSDNIVNNTGTTYVAWNWKANAGSTSSNTDGSITSTVQVNPTAGFSIVTFTGNGSGGSTVGHGLGQTPSLIIQKRRNSTSNWPVYHQAYGINNYTFLNTTDANTYNSTGQTWVGISSSTFSLGTATSWNANGGTYVAYCFVDVEGYSKFGKYTGNGSTDGTLVYTGFRPAFVIYKNTSSTTDWRMFDNKRNSFNVIDGRLFPNTADAENTVQDTVDFLSNGFKLRATNSGDNGSGNTFIYMAFAENPFVTSGAVPVTAR